MNPYAQMNPYHSIEALVHQGLTQQNVQEAQAFSANASGAEKELLEMTKTMAFEEKAQHDASMKRYKDQAEEQMRLFGQCPTSMPDFEPLYARFQNEMAFGANEEVLKILLRDMSAVVVRCMDPSLLRTLIEKQLHAITAFKASECAGYEGSVSGMSSLLEHERMLTEALPSVDRYTVLKVTQDAETYLNALKKVCADYRNSSGVRQWMVQNPGKTKLVGAAITAGLVAVIGPEKIKGVLSTTYERAGDALNSLKDRVFGTAEQQALKEVVAENVQKPDPNLSAEMPLTEKELWSREGKRFHLRNTLLKERDDKKAAMAKGKALMLYPNTNLQLAAEEKRTRDAELAMATRKALLLDPNTNLQLAAEENRTRDAELASYALSSSKDVTTTDAAYQKALQGLDVLKPNRPFPLPQITFLDPAKGAPLERPTYENMYSKDMVVFDPDATLKSALESKKQLAILEAERDAELANANQHVETSTYEQKTAPYVDKIITSQLKVLFREIVQNFSHFENLTNVMERLRWMDRFKTKYGLLCFKLWRQNPNLVANQSSEMVLAMNSFIYELRGSIVSRAGINLKSVNADVDVRLADSNTIQVSYNGLIRFVTVSLV